MRPSERLFTGQDPYFRWRGHDVTRVEYLSDIVFALAFGMVISNGTEPRTFDELNAFLISAVPVTAAFIFMVTLWNRHYTFFRRYALADGKTMFLNACLLLFVLFIAYPVRLIFDGLFGYILLMAGNESYVVQLDISFERAGIIMSYFASALVIIYVILAAMYGHALSRSEQINLSPVERHVTKMQVWLWGSSAIWAAVAGVLAVKSSLGGFAGFLMVFTGVTSGIIRRIMTPKKEELEAAASEALSPPHQTPASSPEAGSDSLPVVSRVR